MEELLLEKYSSTDDYNFSDAPIAVINEKQDLLKRAADKAFFVKVAKGQTDVHIIALGSYEGYGANRNLDAFSEEDCRSNHGTFLKAGGMPDGRGVCRNHRNKKTDPRYGTIKQASYNEPMRRVELVVGLDNDKCAEEIQTVHNGGQISFSMGSKQAYDVCSECGHKSYNGDDDRCNCIQTRLGDITKTGNLIHMKNPKPNWFEISLVRRPADRIAYSIKTAAPHLRPKIAFITDEVEDNIPDRLKISKKASDKLTLVRKLAEIEKHVAAVGTSTSKTKLDKLRSRRGELSSSTIEELRAMPPGVILRQLAKNGIVFSPEEFMKYLFANKVKESDIHGMRSHLSGSFSKADAARGGEVVNNDRFEPDHFGTIPAAHDRNIGKLKAAFSFFEQPSTERAAQYALIGTVEKTANYPTPTDSVFDKKMAEQYTAYKLAALNYLDEQGKLDDAILHSCVWQNIT